MTKNANKNAPKNNATDKVCVGFIGKPHGLKGQVSVKSYTEYPEDIVNYGALTNIDGSIEFKMTIIGVKKDSFLVEIEGVNSKEDVEKIKGEKLYISRESLPEPEEDEFYYSDLVGLEVFENKTSTGRVTAIHNFGAGELLEIKGHDDSVSMVIFNLENVPVVDISKGLIEIIRPEEVSSKDENDDKEQRK